MRLVRSAFGLVGSACWFGTGEGPRGPVLFHVFYFLVFDQRGLLLGPLLADVLSALREIRGPSDGYDAGI